MTSVVVETYLHVGGEMQRLRADAPAVGDGEYVQGAVRLVVDEVEVLSTDLRTDVDWLWPLVVDAVDGYRRTGHGSVLFPDQPITFTLQTVRGPREVLVQVAGGAGLRRSAVAEEGALVDALWAAAEEFFAWHERTSGRGIVGHEQRALLRSWREG